jgi:hypothetical protein
MRVGRAFIWIAFSIGQVEPEENAAGRREDS